MRVLLASDGSRDSRRATRWLRDAPLPSDTRVSALTVATLTHPPGDSRSVRDLRDSVLAEARDASERAARILGRRWPGVEAAVREGDPRVEIVQVAEERPTDLIVLGARGLGPIKRFFLGSVSLAVVRYAPCPVVIVRGRPRPVRRVLVAIDGSEGSREALRFLSIFELVREVSVSLLFVVQGPPTLRGDAGEILADAAAILADTAGPIERSVMGGDPAREIVRVARSSDVDLVVLGARGLRTIGRLLLGSVSETVLHRVGCPVLIVRQR